MDWPLETPCLLNLFHENVSLHHLGEQHWSSLLGPAGPCWVPRGLPPSVLGTLEDPRVYVGRECNFLSAYVMRVLSEGINPPSAMPLSPYPQQGSLYPLRSTCPWPKVIPCAVLPLPGLWGLEDRERAVLSPSAHQFPPPEGHEPASQELKARVRSDSLFWICHP